MAGPNEKLIAAVAASFTELRRVRASGGALVPSGTGGLARDGWSDAHAEGVGVLEVADQGAGHPDGALCTAGQVQKGRPRAGPIPERGVVEVKGRAGNAWLPAESDQTSRYRDRDRLVLVTNLRNFAFVDTDGVAGPAKLETSLLGSSGGPERRPR